MPHPTENAGTRRTGMQGPVSKQTPGLAGVFGKLVEQHRHLTGMLQRAERCPEPTQRQELWIEIRRHLLSHERGEVLELYPALEGYDAARDIIARHSHQAEEIESVINDLAAVDYDSEEWTDRLKDVLALFEEHVEEEEAELFPRAQEILGEQVAAELEERFVSAQREVLNTLV